MKRILLLILVFSVLLCGCSLIGTEKTASSAQITVNMPKDNTVNGYRKSYASSLSAGMPDSISADNTAVGESVVQSQAKTKDYCGNKNSKIFHKSSCGSVSSMKDENKIYFKNRDEFITNGYKPCSRCSP